MATTPMARACGPACCWAALCASGKTVGMKTVCNFAYIENDEPEYLNAVVGDNNASKILAQTYQDFIEDETFWESADEIIETYFDDNIDPERVKKMIRYASRH